MRSQMPSCPRHLRAHTTHSMKAAFITETGPAENIRYDEIPTPEISAKQVLVNVAAVSVNPIRRRARRPRLSLTAITHPLAAQLKQEVLE